MRLKFSAVGGVDRTKDVQILRLEWQQPVEAWKEVFT